jgi:hypothetical protein
MMRNRSVRRLAAAVGVLAAVVSASPARATVGGVGDLGKACVTTPTAKFAPALDGMVRGFVESGCAGDSIDYLSYEPNHPWKVTVQLRTPYQGAVLATAQDPQATYLLYRASDGVRLGKVLRDGTSQAGSLLSKAVGGGLEGSIAVAGGGWYAVWTEPKASGGFAMHAAASPQYPTSGTILTGGAGVDDSAPDIARIGAAKHNFLLAFARHTASGYHLMVAHHATPWAPAKELDVDVENPQPAVTRAEVFTDIAWVHGNTIRLATTMGGPPFYSQTALHQVAIPQATGGGHVGAPQIAYDCGKLYVAFTKGGENSGTVWVDVLSNHKWSRHVLRVAKTAAPVLAGITPRCGSGEVVWTEAGRLLRIKV